MSFNSQQAMPGLYVCVCVKTVCCCWAEAGRAPTRQPYFGMAVKTERYPIATFFGNHFLLKMVPTELSNTLEPGNTTKARNTNDDHPDTKTARTFSWHTMVTPALHML